MFCSILPGFIASISRVSKFCEQTPGKIDGNRTTRAAAALDSILINSVSIAEQLSETDISVPIKIAEVKLSLIDLQTNIAFSQLDQTTKSELQGGIDEVKSSATSAISKVYRMLASFNGALAKIEIYTRSLFNILAKKTGSKEIPSELKAYLEHIESEVERIMRNAGDAHLNVGMSYLVNFK